MLAVGPTMDGEYPQHELPAAGSIPLQNALLHCPWWSSFSQAPYPAFSESPQFMNSTFLGGQPCPDTSYASAATTSSFLPKSSDFPQVRTVHAIHGISLLPSVPVPVSTRCP
uniref:Protein strawberry notch homolog 2-like n=1 Tax=Castor canadensis TaxID=51338 RepID=A0A8B7TXV8_CASCN